MNNYLSPTIRQEKEQFVRFIKNLAEKFQPKQIYCFGQITEINEKEGCFTSDTRQVKDQYFLLMVTENVTRIEHEVQEYANNHYPCGTVTILSHGEETIFKAINSNNRFFITVYSTGKLLYNQSGICNPKSELRFIPTQAANKAQKHYDQKMLAATGFLRGATECLAHQDYNVCTFMLHQVVEQCCIALVRVHLAYRSDIHHLGRLLRLCRAFSDRPIKTLLSGSAEDERLFNLLQKSYSDSRYGSGFSVSGTEAESLYNRVLSFVNVVKDMCLAKIEDLQHEAMLYQELKRSEAIDIIS